MLYVLLWNRWLLDFWIERYVPSITRQSWSEFFVNKAVAIAVWWWSITACRSIWLKPIWRGTKSDFKACLTWLIIFETVRLSFRENIVDRTRLLKPRRSFVRNTASATRIERSFEFRIVCNCSRRSLNWPKYKHIWDNVNRVRVI